MFLGRLYMLLRPRREIRSEWCRAGNREKAVPGHLLEPRVLA
jgi:hypothetical protein